MKASVWSQLAVLQGLFLAGCAQSDTGGGEETGCSSTTGTLEGVVYEDYPWTIRDTADALPRSGAARIRISREGVDPFTAVADADGHYSVDLQEGAWVLFATDTGGGCVSEDGLSADILACATVEFDLHLVDCLEG